MKNRLKLILEYLNLNQKEFANSLGISQGAVSKYLNGSLSIDKKIALSIESAHKINHNWLLTGEGDMRLEKNYEKQENNEDNKTNKSTELTTDEKHIIRIFRETGYRGLYNLSKKILENIP